MRKSTVISMMLISMSLLAVFCSCGGDVQTQDQPSATAVTSAAAETTALHDTPVTMRESTEEDRSRAKEIMEKFQPIVDELNEKYGLPPEIGVGFTYSDETAGIFVDRFGEMTEDDFRAAILKAYEMAEPGDLVALSPACSSFDKFRNFAERGNTFRAIVESLEE